MSNPSGNRKKIERLLSEELASLREDALRIASVIKGRDLSLQSFHAVIGGKNNVYVNSVGTQFADFEDFLAQWTDGLVKAAKLKEAESLNFNGMVRRDSAAHDIARIVRDPTGRAYVFTFLRRNFYRQYNARVRHKPKDGLWAIWFGANNCDYGMLIAPVRRDGAWTNDKSEIRRAPYVYWTIGHVLETGLTNRDEAQPMTFSGVEELLKFYRHVLKKVSNSQYEKGIAERYLAYLSNSADVFSEPFLVPEFRYAGLSTKHEYRLDFTVFNGHTMALTGFELSPHSTHGKIKVLKDKTMKALNAEGATLWAKEMQKRNQYFKTYDIPVVTFTDSDLADLDKCFDEIRVFLSARQTHPIPLKQALENLTSLLL